MYETERKQFDKALAWYILAAMENHSFAQNNIGVLYRNGDGVPKNYLCAMKWLLKSTENNFAMALNNIGLLFEYGYGVPRDKHKALEWYCHGGYNTNRDRLKNEGYHRSRIDKSKSLEQLIKETEVMLDTEKRNLEKKQHKTQKEIETLEQLNTTYKLVDGGNDAWKDAPMLLFEDIKRSKKSVNESVVNYKDEIHMLKKQVQLLQQEKTTFKEKDNKIRSLENENSAYRTASLNQTQRLETLNQEKAILEQRKENAD
ncbi:HCP-like protein, partial [Backusella circina FSU 941]